VSYLKSIKAGLEAVQDFVYPSSCLVCGAYVGSAGKLICPACWDKIDVYDHLFCANCLGVITDKFECMRCSPEDTLPLLAYGHFGDPLGEIIRYFKHRGFSRLGPRLAGRLLDKHADLLKKLSADVIIPIPLHSYRLKLRGFNQAEILADIFGERQNIPVDKKLLRKIKNTRDQKTLDHDSREDNIRGAYGVFGQLTKNKKIMLVDDVVTTGATMREARKVLNEAGGKVVMAAVIATAGSTM